MKQIENTIRLSFSDETRALLETCSQAFPNSGRLV